MRVTGPGVWGPPASKSEAIRLLQRVVPLGVNFIDTADSYGPHVSEELIAEALYPYPNDFVIATKGGYERPGPGAWIINARPERLRSSLEGSLRRLRLDCIDLYQLHRIDPNVPEVEQFGVLQRFQDEGKIRHIGLSEVSVEELGRARRSIAVAAVQNRYNLMDRQSDDVVDECTREGVAFIPWSPLEAGALLTERNIVEIARARRATSSQVAIAWLLHRSPAMLPIPGTSRIDHLEENVAAAALRLSPDEYTRLTAW